MRSLRSKLIVASLLWTSGLLMMMHMLMRALVSVFPNMSGHHMLAFSAAGAAVMGVGLFAALRALAPFRRLRGGITEIRHAQARLIDGAYPTEIQPLVDDLNALIQEREAAVQRAVATAGDLAHGLKTPLAVLTQEADRFAAAGDPDTAARIAQQVDRMSKQIDYQLARARAAPGVAGAPPCPVAPCAAGIVRTLTRLHAARALTLSSTIDPGICALVRKEDLEEMLGNLLDNACKWAKSQVAIAASRLDTMILITVDDDGAGLPPSARRVVLERGIRMDEAAPGSGLGLAIVGDLAQLYAGSICLEDSPLGGLRASLRLPAEDEKKR